MKSARIGRCRTRSTGGCSASFTVHAGADEIAHALSEAGAKVIGPAPTLSQALVMAEAQRIDAAVLDINLGGVLSWPVIDMLLARSVEVMLVSGYDSASVPARYAHLCRWAKPVQIRHLVRSLAREFACAGDPAAA